MPHRSLLQAAGIMQLLLFYKYELGTWRWKLHSNGLVVLHV